MNTANGTLSGTREYGAFGENIAATGVGVLDQWSGIPFGFSTKHQDRLTSHYYYGYRFYDTSTGRWLSRDPIDERGGLNLYVFVGNNGVNSWDMLGMTGEVVGTICCRKINYEKGKDSPLLALADKFFYHCDLEIGRMGCGSGTNDTYSVWIDRSSDDRVSSCGCCCKTIDTESVRECTSKYWKHGAFWGDNCHSATVSQVGNCCLRTNWRPAMYGGSKKGKCLEWETIYPSAATEPPGVVCRKWEFPEEFNNGIKGSCSF